VLLLKDDFSWALPHEPLGLHWKLGVIWQDHLSHNYLPIRTIKIRLPPVLNVQFASSYFKKGFI
jgi:hypothetical protein